MIPSDFGLYDVLNLAATAVGEIQSGRPGFADHAWLNAWAAAEGLFPPGSELDNAVGVILRESCPGAGTEVPARLWRALDTAALTVLTAMDGDAEAVRSLAPGALAAAVALGIEAASALAVILAEVTRTAKAGNGVTT